MSPNRHTGRGLTHIFHVVLYTILSKVCRGVDGVELSCELDVRLLKCVPDRSGVCWSPPCSGSLGGRQHSLNPRETIRDFVPSEGATLCTPRANKILYSSVLRLLTVTVLPSN